MGRTILTLKKEKKPSHSNLGVTFQNVNLLFQELSSWNVEQCGITRQLIHKIVFVYTELN